MTLRVLQSSATGRNPQLKNRPRVSGETNEAWISRMGAEQAFDDNDAQTLIVLLGGADPLSFRLRVAQSHVRSDLTPSSWSHVLILAKLSSPLRDSPTYEVSLSPVEGFGTFGFPMYTNGIQEEKLAPYLNTARFPNIALISVPVPSARLLKKSKEDKSTATPETQDNTQGTIERLKQQRTTIDVPQLILRWLSYCWGVGVPSSPLADGFGLPSAAVIENAFAAAGFDLTPGLESRASCPEAIWQAARWWHEYYEQNTGKPMRGAYTSEHNLVPVTAEARQDEPDKPKSRRAATTGRAKSTKRRKA